jgi:tripartite-type tricarboxylate transporter receptor subunit TctC
MQTRQSWFVGVAAATILAMPCVVQSQQQYPTQPVTMTITFAPGGSADLTSRLVADKLSAKFGQPFVIDPRPGGGGEVGLVAVARSAPDGHRLLTTSNGSVAMAGNLRKVSYDAEADLVPVAMLVKVPSAIAVNASLSIKNIAELVRYSKEKVGGLSYGNSGAGSFMHVAGEILRHKTGANLVAVPYRGAALTARGVLAGEVDMGIADLTSLMPFAQEGSIRILALVDSSRTALAPEIPTVAESGVPGVGLNAWLGIFAPRNTPPNIVALLNAGINEALESPDVRQKILRAGIEPWIMSPQQMAEFVKDEIALWKNLIREANVKLQQ